ncbi:replication initiator [Streptomyces chartreusis]|uniref:replication initiator n=1 Tax=Streptomyces chartreusis TaxID=1969 RepID=UPI0038128143
MGMCWLLGGLPEYASLRPRTWAHAVGYRGHILTKSRAYSTTYAALRAELAHHAGHTDVPRTVTDAQWRYVGSGHSPGAALIAAGVSEDLAISRELARDAVSSTPGAPLVPDELRRRVTDSRARQGLPPVIQDLPVIERVVLSLSLIPPDSPPAAQGISTGQRLSNTNGSARKV